MTAAIAGALFAFAVFASSCTTTPPPSEGATRRRLVARCASSLIFSAGRFDAGAGTTTGAPRGRALTADRAPPSCCSEAAWLDGSSRTSCCACGMSGLSRAYAAACALAALACADAACACCCEVAVRLNIDTAALCALRMCHAGGATTLRGGETTP